MYQSTPNADSVSVTSHTRYAALACWPRPDLGRVRPTYQCVPSHRAPGVTAGSGVAPPSSSAARPGELGAGESLPTAGLAAGVKSDPLLPAAARARSTRCRWFLARSARSIQPSGSAAAERPPRGELPSCPCDSRACRATGEWVAWWIGGHSTMATLIMAILTMAPRRRASLRGRAAPADHPPRGPAAAARARATACRCRRALQAFPSRASGGTRGHLLRGV